MKGDPIVWNADGWRVGLTPIDRIAGPYTAFLVMGELPWLDEDFTETPAEAMVRRAVDVGRQRLRRDDE